MKLISGIKLRQIVLVQPPATQEFPSIERCSVELRDTVINEDKKAAEVVGGT